MNEPEWVEWDAGPGRLPLSNGTFVEIEDGDMVLIVGTVVDGETYVMFLSHMRKTVH